MTAFAAGCAICGADLDVRRWDTGPDRLNRMGSWLVSLGFRPDGRRAGAPVAVAVVLVGGCAITGAILGLADAIGL